MQSLSYIYNHFIQKWNDNKYAANLKFMKFLKSFIKYKDRGW